MALSEEEQRLLEQMEAELAAEDPRLANALRGPQRHWYRRRVLVAALGFAVGVTVLVLGMEWHPLVSVLGFLIMLIATVVGLAAWRHADPEGVSVSGGPGSGRAQRNSSARPDDRRRRGDDDLPF
ncbi:MAG: DUF3040 domain-containing protein [Propionicimonas sp.]